jgi:hypothetical protein
MKREAPYIKAKFALGLASLVVGVLAANLALFNWVDRVGLNYFLGEYARYVCAYGGFGAMIFGAMLINDFIVSKRLEDGRPREQGKKPENKPFRRNADYQRILVMTAWLLAEELRKPPPLAHEGVILPGFEKEEMVVVPNS